MKRPHQQPRVILTTEQVEKLERSVAAALPAVGQWAAFGGVVAGFTGFLWGWAGLPTAGLYASSVASGTAWALAWDHVMPGGSYAASFLYRLHAIDASARWRAGDAMSARWTSTLSMRRQLDSLINTRRWPARRRDDGRHDGRRAV